MYDKEYYRTSLRQAQKYMKITQFARDCDISLSNLSKFLKGNEFDGFLSYQKLDVLCGYINQYCHKIDL